MCGRMTLTRSGDEIAAYFAEAMAMHAEAARLALSAEGPGRPLRPRFNLAPSHDVLTLVPAPVGTGDVAAFAWKRWGLLPSWAKDPNMGQRMFNARSETVAEKPSFRAAFKRRRCLVAADGFYEWTPKNRDHRPYRFMPTRQAMLGFAGLFEQWRGEGGEIVESCTVLTTEANADLAEVHHRMPVILDPDDYAAWLDPEASPEALIALMRPATAGTLKSEAVTRYVNDPRHDDPRCLEPEPKAEQGALFSFDQEEEEF